MALRATRPPAPHATPAHEAQAAVAGDHEESGARVGPGGGRVDFHRSSARASATAAGGGEAVTAVMDDARVSNWNVSA